MADTTAESTTNICEDCGKAIPAMVTYASAEMGAGIPTKPDRCDGCKYEQIMRHCIILVRKPFRSPFPRRKRDGRVPEIFVSTPYSEASAT